MPGDFKHVLTPFPRGPGRRSRGGGSALLGLILATAAWAAGEAPSRPPEFRRLAPLPALREAAVAAGLAWTGLAAPPTRVKLVPGDGVTVLVSLTKGRGLQQWLIDLAMVEAHAGDPLRVPNAARLFTSTGHQFRFDGGSALLAITMIGPLEAADAGRKAATAPSIRRQRVQVSSDFLALGLERVPAVLLRVRARRAADPTIPAGDMSIGASPFPAAVVARDAKAAAAGGITEADERAFIGSILALQEFLQLASRTPGLQDVLMSVLDVPWWSIMRSGGRMEFNLEGLPFDRELEAGAWGLPATEPAYASPFLLLINGRPALRFQLAVAAPKPPLTVSAGIFGLAAGAPDGKGPVLTFQVVASRVAR